MHDDTITDHGVVYDGQGRPWTWRGRGYAIEGTDDVDWKGRPWTTSRETIIEKFGRPGPSTPKPAGRLAPG